MSGEPRTPDDANVAAIFDRLRQEVRERPPTGGVADTFAPRRLPARYEAERHWAVTVSAPVVRRPGLRGLLFHPFKILVRKLVRWYVEPFATQQRAFNVAMLKLVDELAERVLAAPRDGGDDERAARGLDLRSRDVRAFEEAAPVLVLACGRGEFLALLREAGIEARGVEADAELVALCRERGLDVEETDPLAYLESLPDGSLGGIFAERLFAGASRAASVRLLELAEAKLRPGGILLAERAKAIARSS